MSDYTRFTRVEAEEFKGDVVGNVTGDVTGNVNGKAKGAIHAVQISKADDYTMTEKAGYVGVTMTAASKSLVLGLGDGEACLVHNEGGTNAFTLKNLSGDTGTSLAAGKAALVVGSGTADGAVICLLN